MAFDSLVTHQAVTILNEEILTSRIMKVCQPDKFTILLKLHHQTGKKQLLLSTHPQSCRIQLTKKNYENPVHPPMFCMLLRKYLEGSRIYHIEQIGTDRIIKFSIDATNEIGDPLKLALYLEIMGKHSNLILVNEKNNLIIDGMRRFTHVVSRHREILPGEPYILPPQQNKQSLAQMQEEQFHVLCLKQQPETRLLDILYKNIAGISPLTAKLILAQCDLEENTIIDTLGLYEYQILWQKLNQLEQAKQQEKTIPILLCKENDIPIDYTVFSSDLPQIPGIVLTKISNVNELLENYFGQKEEVDLLTGRKRELLKIIGNHLQRVEKKLHIQKVDLQDAYQGEIYKEKGELITAYIYQIEKGMKEITLPSFYREDEYVSITLQPELTPAENSRHYFKKYNKAKISQQQLEQQVSQNQNELDYLNSVYTLLEQCETINEITAIKEELQQEGYLKTKVVKVKEKTTKQTDILPPRSYRSPDGFEILVGRNNKQNDQLTLKIARKEDVWLHTKDIPGSHVIIRNPQKLEELPETTLLFAANLAAWYSKARNSSQVPVDYTLIQFIRKPNGAKPGKVIFNNQKTLFITPQMPKATQE